MTEETTLPETNLAPETGWLENYFPIREAYLFSGAMLVSGRIYYQDILLPAWDVGCPVTMSHPLPKVGLGIIVTAIPLVYQVYGHPKSHRGTPPVGALYKGIYRINTQ